MTSDRDQLAELIWRWMFDNNDDYVENPDDPYIDATDVRIDATLNLPKLADAILAAGWRPPETCDHVWLRPLESRHWDRDPDTCGRCGQSRGRDLHR